MTLEMAYDEARELKTALEIRLVEMRGELAHTDDRAYRNDLLRSLEQLEHVAERLGKTLGMGGES
jgi:polysaccharide deacetylase 2 family uncharacterized protein YibQ